jgi:hypothetical protein
MFSGLIKFILGFLLAIAVLIGGGVAVGLYFINRTGISPAKPVYSNDSASVKAQAPKTTGQPTLTPGTPIQSSPTATESPKATPSPKPLPAGAYRGRVSWAEGLSLRKEPNQDAEKIGGVSFNQKIIILEESQDKAWQKIRLQDSEQEGWVKAGNTEKVDEQ